MHRLTRLSLEDVQIMAKALQRKAGEHLLIEKSREQHWHATRMSKALENRLVPHVVHVDNLTNPGLVITHYPHKQLGRCYEIYTHSIDDRHSDEAVLAKCAVILDLISEHSTDCAHGLLASFPIYLYNAVKRLAAEKGLHNIDTAFANALEWRPGDVLVENSDEFKSSLTEMGYYFGPIPVRLAGHINSNYQYARHATDLIWIEKSLSGNYPNYGIWHRDEDSIVGYIITMECGTFGAFSINPAHRNKGLGQFLVTEYLNRYGKTKENVMLAETDANNKTPYRMFTKVGMMPVAQTFYQVLSRHAAISHDY